MYNFILKLFTIRLTIKNNNIYRYGIIKVGEKAGSVANLYKLFKPNIIMKLFGVQDRLIQWTYIKGE